MASFTDNTQALSTFNPYIQQLPVEAMTKVGMAKQQQYDEGIQKIQTNIDNIAGLDIYKDSDKAYLQSKMNQLGSNLKVVGAGDFSDFQLVNSVNGMTNQIAKDPTIQTAVGSTASAKKELAFMDEERKKGNLNPSNEYVFKKKFSKWADNGEIGESFNAKYDTYFDVFKYTKETFDSLKPDGYSFDQIFQTGTDGKPLTDKTGRPILSQYMKRLEKEGIFPERVKETLTQVFSDPRVGKQLSIDGQYNFSSLDETQLKSKVENKRNNDLSKYQETLYTLNMQKSMGKNVDSAIDNVIDNIHKINTSYDDLLQSTDLDGIRGSLYKQDVYDRYTNIFTSVKTKEQILESPAFKQQFELNKEANRRQEVAWQHSFDVKKYEREDMWKQKNYDLDVTKAQIEANKTGKGKKTETVNGGINGPFSTADNSMAMADNKYTSAANNYSTSQDMFIWETVFRNDKNNVNRIKQIQTDSPTPISDKQAISIFLRSKAKDLKMNISQFRANYSVQADQTMATLKKQGVTISPEVITRYNDIKQNKKVFDQELSFKTQRDKVAVEAIEKLGLDKEFANIQPETIDYRGQKVVLSKQNQIDLATYMVGKGKLLYTKLTDEPLYLAGQQAKKRLEKAGLGDIAERYLQIRRQYDWSPVTNLVGTVADLGSSFVDLAYSTMGNKTELWPHADKFRKLASAINDKSYSKVTEQQSRMIKNQYHINPNKYFSLLTGDTETDKTIVNDLNTFADAFTKGDVKQNLATDKEFSAFQTALGDEKSKYTTVSETDENGNPVWAIVSTDSNSNKGKMVLNPDMSAKLGYNAEDIFESNSVMFLRDKLSQYGGKTSIGNPNDMSTYTQNEDYFYDNAAGDFTNVNNPNYTVRVNVSEYNGAYYPYIYANDGSKENLKSMGGFPNLSQLDAAVRKIGDADIKSILNNK